MVARDDVGRPRVYITIRRGKNLMVRVLDMGFVNGAPVAVLAWVIKNGAVQVGKHIPLDPMFPRKAAPLGSFQYDEIVVDPP